MTSSNGNIFCITGPLCVEFTSHRWISRTKASDAELWCILWSANKRLNKQSWGWWFEMPSHSLWRHCNAFLPKGPINNISVLVQVMAWRQPGDKPLSEPTRYVNGTPTPEVTPVTICYIHPPHHGHTSQYHGHEWMAHILFEKFHVNRPSHSIRLFHTLTLKLQGQGHVCGQRTRSYSRPSILLICFFFISHQSDQQFLRYSYFVIWPWNIQSQGHEWGQRSRSHIIPSIQPMHFLFVSHQSDQPFLRYGKNSVWPWKNTSKILKENLVKTQFPTGLLQNLNR